MASVFKQAPPIVLRESIRARTTVVPVTFLAAVLVVALYTPFLIKAGAEVSSVFIWTGPMLFLMFVRGLMSARMLARLDEMSRSELTRSDWALRLHSMLNQTVAGSGIWLIGSGPDPYPVIPLFVTMLIAIWAIGTLANLFSDALSLYLSMPLLMGQPAVYWILYGDIGISIGIGILLVLMLMLLLVHRGSEVFSESVLMRFEKDLLLRQVAEEQQKTEEALSKARKANDAKDFFMAAAGHDIQQPLYALSMLTDTLLMCDPPASTVPLLKNQKSSIAALANHFDALMDMSKFHDGSFELSLAPVNMRSFAARIDVEIAPLCEEKQLHWHLDMADVVVHTDQELMLRLLRNLLTNAVRYTDEGEVRCTARRERGSVEVEVADTGDGIPAEQSEAVFGEFVRLGQSDTPTTGTGLGLSIVKRINSALQLGLTMDSRVGLGTRFKFHLPLVEESQDSDVEPIEERRAVSQ